MAARLLAVVAALATAAGLLVGLGHTSAQAPAPEPEQAPAPAAVPASATVPRVAPAPDARIPTGPHALATLMVQGDIALRAAIVLWRSKGDPSKGAPPQDVTLEALFQQRVLRMLSQVPALARRVTQRLPPALAHSTRELIASLIDIRRLGAGHRPRPDRIRTGAPAPLGVLIGHYREGQRRFKVGLHVLAAVNLVETAFGRLRNDSHADAQGPMQFIRATWRAYGMGGNVRDPHDAILGAANYLSASGAPDYRRALFHYNPSRLYVNAVRRFARLINRDRERLAMLYSWQVFVRQPDGGERRVTGPGLEQ